MMAKQPRFVCIPRWLWTVFGVLLLLGSDGWWDAFGAVMVILAGFVPGRYDGVHQRAHSDGRRWVVMRYGAGVTSTMGPVPTRLRYWTRQGAERTADRMTARSKWGGWYEAARNDGERPC